MIEPHHTANRVRFRPANLVFYQVIRPLKKVCDLFLAAGTVIARRKLLMCAILKRQSYFKPVSTPITITWLYCSQGSRSSIYSGLVDKGHR